MSYYEGFRLAVGRYEGFRLTSEGYEGFRLPGGRRTAKR